MNISLVTSEEHTLLTQIIQAAYKNYLQEDRSSRAPSFNILRVLSTFRQMYPNSPINLHDKIMYITKVFNPQKHNQWVHALSQMKMTKATKTSQSFNHGYPKTFHNSNNRSIMSDYFDNQRSQINTKTQSDRNQQKDISETNIETGKRYHTRNEQPNDIGHYISFEKNDKENFDFTNRPSQRKDTSSQYMDAINRQLNRSLKNQSYFKTRTPIDQSFVKILPSNQSPFPYSKTSNLLTHQKGRDIIDMYNQFEQNGITQEEWENMVMRAEIFHKLNLKSKAYDSLLANFLVIQEDKQRRLKAKLQYRVNLTCKAFHSLSVNLKLSQVQRIRQEMAVKHHKTYQLRKIFKIIKLLYEIRFKREKIIKVEKFNAINYEFLLEILFNLKGSDSPLTSSRSSDHQVLQLNGKMDVLIENDRYQKVFQVIRYFGKINCLGQKQISEIIKKYKDSICQRVFAALKKQSQNAHKYLLIRERNLEKRVFLFMKDSYLTQKEQKRVITSFKETCAKKMAEKVFKVFLQCTLSTKIYSKRCQYIHQKYQSKFKLSLLRLWRDKSKESIRKRQILMSKSIKMNSMFNNFLVRFSYRKVVENAIDFETRLNNCNLVYERNLTKKYFRGLSEYKDEAFQIKRVSKIYQKKQCLKIFIQWEKRLLKSKGARKFHQKIQQMAFRHLLKPQLNLCIEQYQNQKQEEGQIQEKIFRQLFRIYKVAREERKDKVEGLISNRKRGSSISFIQQMKKEKQLNINLKIKNQMFQNVKKAKQLNEKNKKLKSLRKIQYFCNYSKQQSEKEQKLFIFIKRNQKKLFINEFRSYKALEDNNFRLKQLLMKDNQLEVVRKVKNQIEKQKKNKIISKIISKNIRILSVACSQLHKNNSHNNAISIQNHLQKLKKKAISSLLQSCQQSKQKILLVEDLLLRKSLQFVGNGLKTKITQIKLFKKLKQKERLLNRKIFIKNLKQFREFEDKKLWLNNKILAIHSSSILQGLQLNCLKNTFKPLLRRKYENLSKQIFRKRLRNNYISTLINKKHQFMALKFRALKLSQLIFKKWPKSIGKQNKICSKKNRRKQKERLSTDFAEE